MELIKTAAPLTIMETGSRETAFCGPASEQAIPRNNGFSIRHSTRNFPNREATKLQNSQNRIRCAHGYPLHCGNCSQQRRPPHRQRNLMLPWANTNTILTQIMQTAYSIPGRADLQGENPLRPQHPKLAGNVRTPGKPGTPRSRRDHDR